MRHVIHTTVKAMYTDDADEVAVILLGTDEFCNCAIADAPDVGDPVSITTEWGRHYRAPAESQPHPRDPRTVPE